MTVLIICSSVILAVAAGAALSVLAYARWGPRVAYWAADRKAARGILANEQANPSPTRTELRSAVSLVRSRRSAWQHRLYTRPESLADDHRLTCAQQVAVAASRAAEDELGRERLARATATRAVLEVIQLRQVLGLPATDDAAADIAADSDQPLDIVFATLASISRGGRRER